MTTIEDRLTEIVRQELVGQDLRIRRIVRQELETELAKWEHVDEPDTPAPAPPPPVVTTPRPPAPPSRPALDLVVDVRANDPATFGPGRTNESQVVTAGAVFNFDNGNNDPTADRLGGPLRFAPETNQVHGFVMQDGSTTRFGSVQRAGRLWIRSAGQFVDDGSYHPNHPERLRVGPGGSDKLFHDGGPRTQQSFIPLEGQEGLRVGPDADTLTFAIEFIVEPWMFGQGHTTGPFELHSPIGCPISSPMGAALNRGQVIIWAKSEPSGPMQFPGRQPSNDHNVGLAQDALPEPGSAMVLIAQFRCDPTAPRSSWFEAWTSVNGSLPKSIGRHRGFFGYSFAEHVSNGQFYPIVGQVYASHSWEPISWNWDSSTANGNVRRLDWDGALVDRTGQMTVGDVMDHARTVASKA